MVDGCFENIQRVLFLSRREPVLWLKISHDAKVELKKKRYRRSRPSDSRIFLFTTSVSLIPYLVVLVRTMTRYHLRNVLRITPMGFEILRVGEWKKDLLRRKQYTGVFISVISMILRQIDRELFSHRVYRVSQHRLKRTEEVKLADSNENLHVHV